MRLKGRKQNKKLSTHFQLFCILSGKLIKELKKNRNRRETERERERRRDSPITTSAYINRKMFSCVIRESKRQRNTT